MTTNKVTCLCDLYVLVCCTITIMLYVIVFLTDAIVLESVRAIALFNCPTAGTYNVLTFHVPMYS